MWHYFLFLVEKRGGERGEEREFKGYHLEIHVEV